MSELMGLLVGLLGLWLAWRLRERLYMGRPVASPIVSSYLAVRESNGAPPLQIWRPPPREDLLNYQQSHHHAIFHEESRQPDRRGVDRRGVDRRVGPALDLGRPDRRSSPDRRQISGPPSLPLVAPGMVRRRAGLESLVNMGHPSETHHDAGAYGQADGLPSDHSSTH